LFQEFTRIKNSKTKEISGSGLGLSIVKRIIDIYNGRIVVKSTPDVGTTFTVSLPISSNINDLEKT
jgi:signal transduction histidine kinase